MKSRFLLPVAAVLFTAAISFGINALAQSYSEPTQAPTGGNAPAPLDTSANANTKIGGLLLNSGGAATGLIVQSGNVGIDTASPGFSLDVEGNTGINATKFCIGGANCITAWPSGSWTTSGNNIYNSNSGNVGIDTASPGYSLDVEGSTGINATKLCISGNCITAWPSAGTPTIVQNTCGAPPSSGCSVSCGSGQYVYGGGVSCQGTYGYTVVSDSYPSSSQSWFGRCTWNAGTTGSFTSATVYALCK